MIQARVNQPPESRLPSATVVIFGVMLAMTAAAVMWTFHTINDPSAFPIEKVLVEGDFTHLDPPTLKLAVIDAVDAGFFGVDVSGIRARLLEEPWIHDATIRRVWPDELQVQIVEQVPVARWGRFALLNDAGDIFAPLGGVEQINLVDLSGPLGTELEVLRRYREFKRVLAAVGLEIAALELSARHAWSIELDDNTRLTLGRKHIDARLGRFVAGYRAQLKLIWPQIERIDLRYTNGFAIAVKNNNDGDLSPASPITDVETGNGVNG